jgi:hypothetical protein
MPRPAGPHPPGRNRGWNTRRPAKSPDKAAIKARRRRPHGQPHTRLFGGTLST